MFIKQGKKEVGKRPVKVCTDKVNLSSLAKNLFVWKISYQAVIDSHIELDTPLHSPIRDFL